MENFTTKLQIGNLEGRENWATWRYKISIMLRGVEGAMEAAEGTLIEPVAPARGAGDAEVGNYNLAMAKYRKTECSALLIITTNISEETLKKVMRFKTAVEVWQELHRLFDGQSDDRAYNLCAEFFSFQYNKEDDVSTHMSKLKNIWDNLNEEITKKDATVKLPDLFLICKILDTLDERYFAFKSSWLLLNSGERTVNNLTSHLCAFERALGNKDSKQEALAATRTEQRNVKQSNERQLICNYCSGKGHIVRRCKKWIKDGRPPKPTPDTSAAASTSKQVQHISLMVNACSKGQSQDRESWFVDNGATTHIAVRSNIFQEFHEFDSDHTISTADGSIIPALGKGTVEVESNVSGKTERITLNNVWLVPSLTKNLFSPLAAQDRMQNSFFSSTTTECKLDIYGTTKVVGKRVQYGGLYKLDMKTIIPMKPKTIEVNTVTGSNLLQLYHERFAHQDKRHVIRLVKRELGIQLSPDNVKCEGCIYGKAHRKQFGTRERATAVGELIHTDVCGPFVDSISKFKYYVLFKDDYSGYRIVYFIRNKFEVKDKLLQMLQEAKTAGYDIKTILSDNGGEFDNREVRNILQKYGVQQRLTMPYTPEQNGCSERENRILVEAARSILHTRGELPQMLWAELINTAAYVLNRTGPTRVDGKVPYELWHGKKPKISHLRIIGSECFAHIPKQKRKKLNKKAIKGKLIGYENDDGYRIWDGNKTLRSRDITFQSDIEFRISTQMPLRSEGDNPFQMQEAMPENFIEPDTSHEHALEGDIISQDQVHERVSQYNLIREEVSGDENEMRDDESANEEFVDADEQLEVVEPALLNETPRYNLRDRANLSRPEKFKDYVCFVDTLVCPETYKEAVKRDDRANWLNAMASEMNSLKQNDVWTLCELPKHKKALPCKWVFRIKQNPDGSIEKYKARLVVKGFKQQKGIDYNQTFSPVARMATVRALISVAAKENLYLMQFDVSTAFLNGKLTEEIYMQQPDGFSDNTSNVCRLKKSLYGLKQSPRCWNSCFAEILLQRGFEQNPADCCLYTKKIENKKILIALYVDDGLVAATDKELANQFLQELGETLKITTKPASFYLGIEIERKDGTILIHQRSYTEKVLKRFGMSECKPIGTPIEKADTKGEDNTVDKSSESAFPYREAVGSLAYLMVATRPDIAYAVGIVSRSLENPTKTDWLRVKRIMRYLKGTTTFGVTYGRTADNSRIIAYSDADHGGCTMTGRSTTGIVCYYGGGPVSWQSQRQGSVSMSTTEAEIVAASDATRELVWLKRIFSSLLDMEKSPLLFVDNEAAVKLAHNPEFHKRTKHIRIRHFFVREAVMNNEIEVERIGTEEQVADIMTKALPKPRFQILRSALI